MTDRESGREEERRPDLEAEERRERPEAEAWEDEVRPAVEAEERRERPEGDSREEVRPAAETEERRERPEGDSREEVRPEPETPEVREDEAWPAAEEPDYLDQMQARASGQERPARGRSRARQNRRKESAPSFFGRKAGGSGSEQGGAKAGAAGLGTAQGEDGERAAKSGSRKKKFRIAAAFAAAVLLAGAAFYAAAAQQYRSVFFPGTQINGLDASGMTVAQVREAIAGEIGGYVLTLTERGDQTEEIRGEAIGLRPEFDGTLEKLIAAQNPYAWLEYRLSPASYLIDTMVIYEEEALRETVGALRCLDPSQMTEPTDARISAYVPGQGYQIEPETEGTVVEADALYAAVEEAILNLQENLDLEEAGVYREPAVRSDDPLLARQLESLNRIGGMSITYVFGDEREVLGGDRIQAWVTAGADGSISVDETQVAAYVEELAAGYNTAGRPRTFKTSYGKTIEVKGGTYGWSIDQEEETKALAAVIAAGESQEREPVYARKAASRSGNDYGDTYVEINLTAQHLFFYKNGSLLVESDFVSGNLSRGWGTPAGSYPLTYKQRDAVLKGENYRTPVDFWMPFNGGIGMHDATWRSSFGGTIYKTNGSHGCINLPYSVAKKIYENISAGDPVICYNLAGTEKSSSSSTAPPPAETQAPTQPVETQPAPTLPAETQPVQPSGPSDETKPQTPAGPSGETQAPAQPAETQPIILPAETQTPAAQPAGPSSDMSLDGGGTGPGAAS